MEAERTRQKDMKWILVHSLKLTASFVPVELGYFSKRKRSYSKHLFLGAMLVSGSVCIYIYMYTWYPKQPFVFLVVSIG